MTRFIPLLALFVGCAHQGALHTETSTSAIATAEAVGAKQVPQASLHLQYAKEEEDAAKALNQRHKDAEAKSLLERAAADAELAAALSKLEAEEAEAEAAKKQLETIHN